MGGMADQMREKVLNIEIRRFFGLTAAIVTEPGFPKASAH